MASVLVVIFDCNLAWWGSQTLQLTKALEETIIFLNAHRLMDHNNEVALICSSPSGANYLFPEGSPDHEALGTPAGNGTKISGNAGQYDVFKAMDNVIVSRFVRKITTELTESRLRTNSLVSRGIVKGLCFINKVSNSTDKRRILTIKSSSDSSMQYMSFMNAIFTAQKYDVVIDGCVIGTEDSALLQQACDVTGGIYMKLPDPEALLQYLLWVYIPDQDTRPMLTLPPKTNIDYRAACFCHQSMIDVGYVCSVCLSIYCSFSPICATCHCNFKLKGPMMTRKKKGYTVQ